MHRVEILGIGTIRPDASVIRMHPDESSGTQRDEPRPATQILQFDQRIIVRTISVRDGQHGSGSVGMD